VDRKGAVVRFNHSVRYLGGRHNGESLHHSVRVFFLDLRDQESSHSRSSTSSEGVHDLESLKAITSFSFLSHHVQHGVNQFSSFSVVSLGPVVSCSRLSEYEVVGSEELSIRSSSD